MPTPTAIIPALRRLDSDRRVFKDDRSRRLDARLFRRDQEHFGIGLAAMNVFQAGDRRESAGQAAFADRQIKVRPHAAGADRQEKTARGQAIQQLANPLHQDDAAGRRFTVAGFLQIAVTRDRRRVVALIRTKQRLKISGLVMPKVA